MQFALRITMEIVIMHVVAAAMDPMHVTVMYVANIPTSITGDTVYVMTAMPVIIVEQFILM
jgi:hypothetical protein